MPFVTFFVILLLFNFVLIILTLQNKLFELNWITNPEGSIGATILNSHMPWKKGWGRAQVDTKINDTELFTYHKLKWQIHIYNHKSKVLNIDKIKI